MPLVVHTEPARSREGSQILERLPQLRIAVGELFCLANGSLRHLLAFGLLRAADEHERSV
jgi:hypothetical protein